MWMIIEVTLGLGSREMGSWCVSSDDIHVRVMAYSVAVIQQRLWLGDVAHMWPASALVAALVLLLDSYHPSAPA